MSNASVVYTILSADVKPTVNISIDQRLIEVDTGDIYKFNGTSWDYDYHIGGGGSGDMSKSVYDAANKNAQIAVASELAAKSEINHEHAESDVTSLANDLLARNASILRYRLAGRYHSCYPDSNGTLALTINRLYAVPFYVAQAIIVTRMAIHVTTLGTAAHARLGIYQDNGSTYPSTRIVDAGIVDCSATGVKAITGLNITLSANTLYWLSLVADVAHTVSAFAVVYANDILGYPVTAFNTIGFSSYYVAFTYAALPTPYPGSATLNNAAFPKIAVYF